MLISKKYGQIKIDSHLHSPAHVLADELSVKFNDKKHFGFYLKTALRLNHEYLRQLAGRVLEGTPKKPAALFAYLIKKENASKNINNS
jgi:hypothetical protein